MKPKLPSFEDSLKHTVHTGFRVVWDLAPAYRDRLMGLTLKKLGYGTCTTLEQFSEITALDITKKTCTYLGIDFELLMQRHYDK